MYGAEETARAAEIASLRALGLSLHQVARVLDGDSQSLESALAAHERILEGEIRRLVAKIDTVRRIRTGLTQGETPATAAGELAKILRPSAEMRVEFALPWPWGGERFELRDIRPITYIVGPLGSGKTRLAMRLAETLNNATFVGLERLDDAGSAAARLDADATLKSRVDHTLAWLVEEGAVVSPALISLMVTLESDGPAVLVIDMVEQGIDQATQEALIAHLRQRPRSNTRHLFLMTRSSAILDLAAVGPDEAILLCPANHSPPIRVAAYPGAPGYEAVATCLATPEVRARTAGVIALKTAASC